MNNIIINLISISLVLTWSMFTYSQKNILVDSLYQTEVISVNDREVKIEIFNNSDSDIFISNKDILGGRSYDFITSCDSLNSTFFFITANLPINFISKKNMIKIKSNHSKFVKFRTYSKWNKLYPCEKTRQAQAYFKLVIYSLNANNAKVIGYVISSNKFVM